VSDVQKLVKPELLPAGTHWADATETARSIVRTLRDAERARLVVLFGHQSTEEDEALARAVPGIDLILGSHSHHEGELHRIEGTQTWMVSPAQYLTHVSRVRVSFDASGALVRLEGGLVRMDDAQPQNARFAAEVATLRKALEQKRPDRFRVVGTSAGVLSDAGAFDGRSSLAEWATDALRARAGAHVFFATASSFRASIPPGPVVAETFFTAVPYKNAVVVADLTGAQVRAWLTLSATKRGGDGFSPASGVRYALSASGPTAIEILKDPQRSEAGYVPLDDTARYRVATTDYQGFVAAGYKEIFAAGANQARAALDVHEVLLAALAAGVPDVRDDGRVRATP
jgi:5'-nucleotidase